MSGHQSWSPIRLFGCVIIRGQLLTSLPSRMISPRLILETNCRNLELANLPSLSAASVSARAFVCSSALAEFSTRPPA